MDLKLGKLNSSLLDVEEKLNKLKTENKDGSVTPHTYETLRLDAERRKLKLEIDNIEELQKRSKKYEEEQRGKEDPNKHLNPALDLAFNLYLNGFMYKGNDSEKKGEILTMNNKGDIEKQKRNVVNKAEVDKIKGDIINVNERIKTLKAKTSNTALLTDEGNRSQIEYYDAQIKELKKQLKKKQRTFEPLFFIPLGKLNDEKLSIKMFLKDNYKGQGKRSYENIEENIQKFIKVLLEKKKQIQLIGLKDEFKTDKPLKILTYSWRKKEYAPYGYQSSRGPLEMRSFLSDSNLKWLKSVKSLQRTVIPDEQSTQSKTKVGTASAASGSTPSASAGSTPSAAAGSTPSAASSSTPSASAGSTPSASAGTNAIKGTIPLVGGSNESGVVSSSPSTIVASPVVTSPNVRAATGAVAGPASAVAGHASAVAGTATGAVAGTATGAVAGAATGDAADAAGAAADDAASAVAGTAAGTVPGPASGAADAAAGAAAGAPAGAAAGEAQSSEINPEEESDNKNKDIIKEIKEIEKKIELEFFKIRGGSFFDDIKKTVTDVANVVQDRFMTTANRVQARITTVTQTDYYDKMVNYNLLSPKAALNYAVKSYSGFIDSPAIDAEHYSTLRFSASSYSTPQRLYYPYMHEYLAYRFSIFHSWFRSDSYFQSSDENAVPDVPPLLKDENKNTTLLKKMLPYAPNPTIRENTVLLIQSWNEYEINEEFKTVVSQHRAHLNYFERVQMDLLRRLDMFRPTLNYIILKALLQHSTHCHKEKLKDCITTAQRILLVKFNELEYNFSFNEKMDIQTRKIKECRNKTKVVVPQLWYEHFADVNINGIKRPQNNFVLKNIESFDTAHVDDNLNSALRQLRTIIAGYKENVEIKTAITINHELPETCQCMYDTVKSVKKKQSTVQMKAVHSLWVNQSNFIRTEHKNIKILMQEKCYIQLARSGDLTEECWQSLKELNVKVGLIVNQFLKTVSLPHSSVNTKYKEEKYPSYFKDLEELHQRYTVFFDDYDKVLTSLVSTLESLTEKDQPYERTVAQIDYISDAYLKLCEISVSLDPAITLKKKDVNYIRDDDSFVESLQTLCDILEDKMFRGYVSNGFRLELHEQNKLSEKEEIEQQKHLSFVEKFTPMEKGKSGNGTRSEFAEHFAKLKPEYVLRLNDANNLTSAQAQELYKRAKDYCAQGNFTRAIKVSYLFFAFPLKVQEGLRQDYLENQKFLLFLLQHTQQKNLYLIETLPWPPTMDSRNQMLIRQGLNTDSNLANLVQQEFNNYTNNQEVFAKFIANKFRFVDESNTQNYNKCKLNYLCLQFYLGEKTARQVLNQPSFTLQDFQELLRFFPRDHIGRLILGKIHNSLLHTKESDTYEDVARFLVEYQVKRRYALEILLYKRSKTELKLQIANCLRDINSAIKSLAYIAELAESAKYERENEWPKPGSYSTFLRSTNKPYVDGNYTLKVVVDLALSEDSIDKAVKLDCRKKKEMLGNIYSTLNPFGR